MRKRFALAALAGLVAVPAFAQFSRRGGMGGERGERGQGRPSEKGERFEPRANTLEVMLHELEEDLKLTAEQAPRWQAYAERVRALAGDVAREQRHRPASGANALQQIDALVDAARNRLTAMEEVADAAKALYARLAPEQQQSAGPRLANAMALPLGLDVRRTPTASR